MARKQGRKWEDMDKSDIELEVLRRHFELHNKTDGKSPRTVEWYNEVLGLFRVWLEQNGLSTSLGSLGEREVRQFILHLQEKPGTKGPMSSHSIASIHITAGDTTYGAIDAIAQVGRYFTTKQIDALAAAAERISLLLEEIASPQERRTDVAHSLDTLVLFSSGDDDGPHTDDDGPSEA